MSSNPALKIPQQGTELLLGTHPKLDVSRTRAFEKISGRSGRRCYTQLGLAEALRFRAQSSLKREQIKIRKAAFDTFQSMAMSELYVPVKEYFGLEPGSLGSIGFPDFVLHHLLRADEGRRLLTGDARLRQYFSDAADRIVAVDEELKKELGER